MLVLEPACTDEEVSVLRAFRRTASDVQRILAPLAEHSLTLDLRNTSAPNLNSFPEDSLRSLAMAVRQAYMPSEATNFDNICTILDRTTDAKVRGYLDTLRRNWHFALVSPMGLSVDNHTYGGKQVFDTWLYGRAMHRDAKLQTDAERLDKMDQLLLPTWVVQRIVRDLAICIVQLDVAVADALGEEPVPYDQATQTVARPFRFRHRDHAS
jgi:hypothetical protein